MYLFILPVLFAASVLLGSSVLADEPQAPKGPTCQDQLNESSVLAHNLATERSTKEKMLASAQVAIMQLRQRNEQLEKQIAEMQKAVAPKKE